MLSQRVLIAGAGLAGLATAHALAHAGKAVTVFDARDRVGGRMWTVRDPFVAGAYGELGAEFIDDDHRRLHALLSRLGIQSVRVLKHGFTQRHRRDDGGFDVSRTRAWDELRDALAPLVRDYEQARGAPDNARVRELSTFSVRDWLSRSGAPRHLHATADALRGFFLADPEQLSALPLAAELSESTSPAQTPMSRIIGGNDRLLDALVHETDARLLLQHRLVAVRHSDDGVRCTVRDEHDVQHEFEADALVLAVPASTLRDITITPPLPERQWHAMSRLQYGCATKVVVQTDASVFGTRRARAFATDAYVGAFWDASEGQTTAAALTSFLAGGSASAELSERLRSGPEALLSDLCWLRQSSRPLRVRGHVSCRWETDPWARGGYAYLDPGFDPAWLPLLRQPAGRLCFAGEHTSEQFQGYMEGALESAERVSAEVAGLDLPQ